MQDFDELRIKNYATGLKMIRRYVLELNKNKKVAVRLLFVLPENLLKLLF
jgi:hypothetical protein